MAAVVVAGVGYGASNLDLDLDGDDVAAGERTQEGPSRATVDEWRPLAEMCAGRAAGQAADVGGRPDHAAPAPDLPNQHALLVKDGSAYGNLDLAPGGGLALGASEASDAKTVFVVCAVDVAANVLQQECLYDQGPFNLYDPSSGGPGITHLPVALARTELQVVEVGSGRHVGTATVEAPWTDCPEQTQDYRDGLLEITAGLDEASVEWMRTHLAGARYTP